MSTTSLEAGIIPSQVFRTGLTEQQSGILRAVIAERLDAQRIHAARATAVIDGLSSNDTPWERSVARNTLASSLDGVREYEDALARLADGTYGTYGTCDACQRPIPFERLEAIPEVRHCVGCIGVR